MSKLDWLSVDIIRAEYDKCKDKESKRQFCLRMAKREHVSDVLIRQVLNNQRWHDIFYAPYMPGQIFKLNKSDVAEIRNAFINRPDFVSVLDFIDIWSLKKKISKSQIERIIYNKSWYDENYKPPKSRQRNIITYKIDENK